MPLVCQPVVYLLVALSAVAQSPSFATITINPAHSADPRDARVQVRPSGEWVASGISVGRLMNLAYGMPSNGSPRFSPLPNWTLTEKYDIKAMAPPNTLYLNLQDSEVRSRIQQMLRRLLSDRFGLVMRVENKSMAVYALTIANGGPKLLKSAIAQKDCAFNTGPEVCHSFEGGLGHPLNANAIDIDDLVHYVENWTDLPVVNGTALSGLFTVKTEGWLPMRLPPPPPGTTPIANPFAGLPTIFTVLSKLGLELKRQEDVLPVYTVERVEHRLLTKVPILRRHVIRQVFLWPMHGCSVPSLNLNNFLFRFVVDDFSPQISTDSSLAGNSGQASLRERPNGYRIFRMGAYRAIGR